MTTQLDPTPQDHTSDRWAGLAGIGFVIVMFIDNAAAGSPPDLTSSPDAVASSMEAKLGAVNAAGALSMLITPLVLWFLVGVALVLVRSGQRRFGLATAMAGTLGGALVIGSVATFHAAALTNPTVSPDTQMGLLTASYLFSSQAALCLGITMLVASIGIRRSSALPRWYATLGFITGSVAVLAGGIGTTSLQALNAHAVGLLGFLAWTLAGGIALVRSSKTAEVAPGPIPAAVAPH